MIEIASDPDPRRPGAADGPAADSETPHQLPRDDAAGASSDRGSPPGVADRVIARIADLIRNEHRRTWEQNDGPSAVLLRLVRAPWAVAGATALVLVGLFAVAFGIPPVSPLFAVPVLVAPIVPLLRAQAIVLEEWRRGEPMPTARGRRGARDGDGAGSGHVDGPADNAPGVEVPDAGPGIAAPDAGPGIDHPDAGTGAQSRDAEPGADPADDGDAGEALPPLPDEVPPIPDDPGPIIDDDDDGPEPDRAPAG